ncbi:hypothetical protein [Sphingomonas sp. Leaf17]|uniref:hypothetical protein n=1 Tax=Sphingomonas sp. Leaf17 TaxID=1735683 RepID=UPI0012E14B6D|nr:hypothetical protein [Sphingomonas sp. Leaf17]
MLVTTAFIVAPAFGATEQANRDARRAMSTRSLGSFTPSAADPKLAALFARGALDTRSFRFTPSDSREGDRAITVAVRARTNRAVGTQVAAVAPTVGIAPIAYNLGVGVGWKRLAVTGDVGKVDLGGAPGSRERVDIGLNYAGNRFTGGMKAGADRPLGTVPMLVDDVKSYSVDVGGAYSLTRNLDVTAGVRYRSDRERLARTDEAHRDSQAVYVGTAFRF